MKLLIPGLLLLTGCATTLNRPQETISVDSQPGGADAAIACAGAIRASGVTPARLTIPRIADGCVLKISKEGFGTRIVPMERGYSAPYWANFTLLPGLPTAFFVSGEGGGSATATAFGIAGLVGALGFVVDRSNGRAYRHFPDEFNEKLEPTK